jgi:hypothetical protein
MEILVRYVAEVNGVLLPGEGILFSHHQLLFMLAVPLFRVKGVSSIFLPGYWVYSFKTAVISTEDSFNCNYLLDGSR